MMNGAAISLTSKRHTTTDDPTAAAELTECYLCACDIEGYRNLMAELGLAQVEPTIIWQDNQAAIQIAMNRGALAKKSRAMDLKVIAYATQQGGRHEVCANLPENGGDDRRHWHEGT